MHHKAIPSVWLTKLGAGQAQVSVLTAILVLTSLHKGHVSESRPLQADGTCHIIRRGIITFVCSFFSCVLLHVQDALVRRGTWSIC